MKNTKTYKISDILSEELANTETASVFAYTHPIFPCMIDDKPKLLYINSDGKTMGELKYYKTSSVLDMLENSSLSEVFMNVPHTDGTAKSIARLLVIIHPSPKPYKSFVKIKKVTRFPYDYIVINFYIVINLYYCNTSPLDIVHLAWSGIAKLLYKFKTEKIKKPDIFIDISFVSMDLNNEDELIKLVISQVVNDIRTKAGYTTNTINYFNLYFAENYKLVDRKDEYLSEIERLKQEKINFRERKIEGIEAAKRTGNHLGRPRKELPENFEEVNTRRKRKNPIQNGIINSMADEIMASEKLNNHKKMAAILGVKENTFSNWMNKHKGNRFSKEIIMFFYWYLFVSDEKQIIDQERFILKIREKGIDVEKYLKKHDGIFAKAINEFNERYSAYKASVIEADIKLENLNGDEKNQELRNMM